MNAQGQSTGTNKPGDERPKATYNSSFPGIPHILPPERVFSVQIGGELFRLSGASISSDAPSYFSHYFSQQLVTLEEGQSPKPLCIDRDPVTFRDIAKHLQGYHISPTDGQHFVQLFADAQFYSLPRLISQLFDSEIFIYIGSRSFRIDRDLFKSPGNSSNYFTVGSAVFFSAPDEVFPGLIREGLLRPPSILPPQVPMRSGEVFAELLEVLRGYPIHIRNEEHRQQLLRDCRYFHLRGLEQKLIPHEISWNQKRQRPEIVIRLEDIKPSGISFVSDPASPPHNSTAGWINYARPFMEEPPRELVLEIGNEQTKVDWRLGKAEFYGATNQQVSALFQVIAGKLEPQPGEERATGRVLTQGGMNSGNTPSPTGLVNTPLSDVKVRIGPDCFVKVDGEEWKAWGGPNPLDGHDGGDAYEINRGLGSGIVGGGSPILAWQRPAPANRPPTDLQGPFVEGNPRKRRKRAVGDDDTTEWIVKRGQWRLRVHTTQGIDGRDRSEVTLVGVRLDAYSGEYGRNEQRKFLI